MEAVWRIELFGGLRVVPASSRGGPALTRFATRKSAALLALLALAPDRFQPRETLAEQLWSDEDPEATRNRFKQSLALLRKDLEPDGVPAGSVLAADRTQVRLAPGAVLVDVVEFRDACRAAERAGDPAGRARLLSGAERLYRGELLPGYYEERLCTERQHLAETYGDLLDALAEALAATGDVPGALERARRAVTVDPLREPSHLLLIRLLAAAGRPSEALRQYAELERVLREQLQVSPSPAAQALVTQVRSGTLPPLASDHRPPAGEKRFTQVSSPPATASHPASSVQPVIPQAKGVAPTLPHSHTLTLPHTQLSRMRLFGREPELARLSRMLFPPAAGPDGAASRMVTLTGPAGSGKTCLARELAAQAGSPERPVWFVPLAECRDPELLGVVVAEHLRLPLNGTDPAELLTRCFQEQAPCLLVLDNLEHLLDGAAPAASPVQETPAATARLGAAAFLHGLLERSPALSCLATSRQRLEIDSEREFPVLPLATPRALRSEDPADLMRYASVQLFVDRAQAARPGFQLTAENARAIAELCHRLDGLPLAIELAAAWAATLAPAQLLERLALGSELLVARRRDGDPRHQSLRAAVDWSYRQLDPELQRAFARLSIFRGGFSLDAAEAVLNDEGSADRGLHLSSFILHPLESLAGLQERSLLMSEEAGAAMRFRILEPLRDYAGRQLGREEAAICHRRHAEFFLAFAEQAEEALEGPDQEKWLSRLEQERENCRAALEWALLKDEGGRMKDEVTDPKSLHPSEHPSSFILHPLEVALRLAGALGEFWERRGYLQEGRQWLERALERAGTASRSTRARALLRTGVLASYQRDLDRAYSALTESIELFRGDGDSAGMAAGLLRLGHVALQDGNVASARSCFEDSLAVCRAAGVSARTAWAARCLGEALAFQDEPAAARTLYEESLALCRDAGERRGVAASLLYLAGLEIRERDWSVAARHARESLEIHRRLGDGIGTAGSLLCLAETALGQGDLASAHALALEELALRRELDDTPRIATSLDYLAAAMATLGHSERAAWLWGAADAARGGRPPIAIPSTPLAGAQPQAVVRAALGDAPYRSALSFGRAMTPEQALTAAFGG